MAHPTEDASEAVRLVGGRPYGATCDARVVDPGDEFEEVATIAETLPRVEITADLRSGWQKG